MVLAIAIGHLKCPQYLLYRCLAIPSRNAAMAYWKNRSADALEVFARTYGDGDVNHAVAKADHKEITGIITIEKNRGHKTNWMETIKGSGNRKGMLLNLSVAVFISCSGNNFN